MQPNEGEGYAHLDFNDVMRSDVSKPDDENIHVNNVYERQDTYNTLTRAETREKARIDSRDDQLGYAHLGGVDTDSGERPGNEEVLYGNLDPISLDPSQ